MPKLDKPVHLTQFEILINPKNKKNYHHVLVYECDSDFVPEKEFAQECGYIYLPFEISSNCIRKQIIAWAIGGETVCEFF